MAGSAMFSFRAGRKMATAFAAGFAGTYTAISTAKAAHAQAPGNERYMLAGADGPEWASHVLGKSRWNVHSACIAANDPIEDRSACRCSRLLFFFRLECNALPLASQQIMMVGDGAGGAFPDGESTYAGSVWRRAPRASWPGSSMGTTALAPPNMPARILAPCSPKRLGAASSTLCSPFVLHPRLLHRLPQLCSSRPIAPRRSMRPNT
jgi:hypothetical protein